MAAWSHDYYRDDDEAIDLEARNDEALRSLERLTPPDDYWTRWDDDEEDGAA